MADILGWVGFIMAFVFGLAGYGFAMILIPTAILILAAFIHHGHLIEAHYQKRPLGAMAFTVSWNFGGALLCYGVGVLIARLLS